jgi:hypothetical protein
MNQHDLLRPPRTHSMTYGPTEPTPGPGQSQTAATTRTHGGKTASSHTPVKKKMQSLRPSHTMSTLTLEGVHGLTGTEFQAQVLQLETKSQPNGGTKTNGITIPEWGRQRASDSEEVLLPVLPNGLIFPATRQPSTSGRGNSPYGNAEFSPGCRPTRPPCGSTNLSKDLLKKS